MINVGAAWSVCLSCSKNSMHAKVTGDDFTFVATGDIAEMWIRDSAMQVRMTRVTNSDPLYQAV